jgi:predicted metal-dependent enzyme (double-stranded beta helix superfamily)
MKCIETFARQMRSLYAAEPDETERWSRVGSLMPILLDDPELIASARNWPVTQLTPQYGVKVTNLLFYEDPDYGFVVNGLIKDAGAATPVHDHAHTWTAYGLIEGVEKVLRYRVVSANAEADRAVLEPAGEYLVRPGFVDVVPPYAPHAEIATQGRTVAVIVRSERVGSFLQKSFDLDTGQVTGVFGPASVPHPL